MLWIFLSGCSGEKETETPYIYCLDGPSFIFPDQLIDRFQATKVEFHGADGATVESDVNSNLEFTENFQFDLNIMIDCYLNNEEPLCDPLYSDPFDFFLVIKGRIGFEQDAGVKLISICFPNNQCEDVNVETIAGEGIGYIQESTDDYWVDQSFTFEYSVRCEVGTNSRTGEYFSAGYKIEIALEFPLKNGESIKFYFDY